jgi:hypothetical protein
VPHSVEKYRYVTTNGGRLKIWKKTIEGCGKEIFRPLSGQNEENHEPPEPGDL